MMEKVALLAFIFVLSCTISAELAYSTKISETISTSSKSLPKIIKLTRRRVNESSGSSRWMEATSRQRVAHIKSSLTSYYNSSKVENVESELCGGTYSSLFLADISIGSPPSSQYLLMDTGSDLMWVLCKPCSLCPADMDPDSPIFEPHNSSTYRRAQCPSPYCVGNDGKCDSNCGFNYSYADGTRVSGIKVFDTLTFTTTISGGGESDDVIVPNILFGCAKESTLRDRQANGILGLGGGPKSLVSQLNSYKFSYCIGNVEDHEYTHNKLVIGYSSVFEGESTPLELYNIFYYVQLEAIFVGDKRLDIDPRVFRRTTGSDGVIIDSGTSLTYLTISAYIPLEEEVRNLVDVANLPTYSYPDHPNFLCYYGSIFEDLHGFPTLRFVFSGGATLELENPSLFFSLPHQDAFCMAIVMSEAAGLPENENIIGLLAQQNYNVGFDLSARRIYFQNIDCAVIY